MLVYLIPSNSNLRENAIHLAFGAFAPNIPLPLETKVRL